MAAEPGGRADKLGNRYERLWAVQQLLLTLSGEVQSVQVEPPESDAHGVDVVVVRANGVREGHQCKRENGSDGKWTIGALNRENMLSNARRLIKQDVNHRFGLVSSDSPIDLRDLTERTTRCNDDANDFFRNHVQASPRLAKAYAQFCDYLGYSVANDADRREAFELLRRFDYFPFDKTRSEREVQTLARLWVQGDPRSVIDVLSGLLEHSLGKELHADDVRAVLNGRDLKPRDLRGDPDLHPAIERIRQRFERSYEHLLVGGKVIARAETTDAMNELCEAGGSRLVLLHGRAGTGKSGVLYELTQTLSARGIPHLPLRLDRQRPNGTTDHFGRSECHLPGSPAASLVALAGGRPAVLILDQIDAVRWTSAHSADAWDVCEELIQEALTSPNIRVIVACRTFDIEDDPQIRAWKSRNECSEVAVAELSGAALDTFLAEQRLNDRPLTSSQKKLLCSPQLLFLWWTIQLNGAQHVPFDTATDLMGEFWKDRREHLRKMSEGENSERVLTELVGYMDRGGTLTAPARLVEDRSSAVRALISVGVLTQDDGNLVFSHQSYFDYLLARSLVVEVLKGTGSVVDWLLKGGQSLFRRGQLRTLLHLLRDDDHPRYIAALHDIVFHPDIRFHLKHLALQTLGQAPDPTSSEVKLVCELVESIEWRDHVYGLVLTKKTPWFVALDEAGAIARWLESNDEHTNNIAASAMTLLDGACIDRIARLLEPHFGDGETWQKRTAYIIHRIPPDLLTQSLFERFSHYVRTGALSPWMVRWKQLAQANPGRCVRLYASWVTKEIDRISGEVASEPQARQRHPEDGPDDIAAIISAASIAYAIGWRRLLPQFRRLASLRLRRRRAEKSRPFNVNSWSWNQDVRKLEATMERMLSNAGAAMAATAPVRLWRETQTLRRIRSRIIARLVTRSLAGSKRASAADRAVRWLAAKRWRLRTGTSRDSRICTPARELIEKLAPLCSATAFESLEHAILRFRCSWERASYECQMSAIRAGHMHPNEYGLGQYLLLSALPTARMTVKARQRLRDWESKFGDVSRHLESPDRVRGGWVTSTIPQKALRHITDRQWIRLLTHDWSKRRSDWVQLGPEHVGELSPRHIGSDLHAAADREPLRFARLALRLPQSCNPLYFSYILDAFARVKAPEGLTEAESAAWVPAPIAQMEAALKHLGYPTDETLAISYARLIKARSAEPWSDETLEILSQIAIGHTNPAPDKFAVHSGPQDKMQPDVAHSAMSCARGCAAGAIASLLYDHPSLYARLRPAIESLFKDDSVAVRAAAIEICLPLINISRELAVQSFVHICSHADDRVMSSYHRDRVLSYLLRTNLVTLSSVIQRLSDSTVSELSAAGAAWATLAWMDSNQLEDLATRAAAGTDAQREGVAKTIAHNLIESGFKPDAVSRLQRMFDDGTEKVRHAAASIFGVNQVMESDSMIKLCQSFVTSQAFSNDPTWMLIGLENHVGPLRRYAPIIFDVCDQIAGPLAERARDFSQGIAADVSHVTKLLLRLHQQAEGDSDATLQRNCLDRWDRLLAARVGFEVLNTLDE